MMPSKRMAGGALLVVGALLVSLAVQLRPAAAAVSGSAEIGYASYDAEANGARVTEASTLAQRYSLTYNTYGVMRKAQYGSYKLSLGYQWASLDTTVKTFSPGNPAGREEGIGMTSGKFLYRGEVNFNPPQLPLEARAYLYDTSDARLVNDTIASLNDSNRLTAPGIGSDLINPGMNVTGGFSLLFGLKSGMKSSFNPILTMFPRVLVDYKETVTKNTTGQFRTDARLRKLALSSLNKGDNWLHYRATQYDDFINRDNSFSDHQIQLGLIDGRRRRNWVDFTNWIRLSADGQFAKHQAFNSSASQEYDINLLAIATRRSWNARTFLNYNRLQNGSIITTQRIPLYVNGIWGRETEWSVRTSIESQKELQLGGGKSEKKDDVLSVRITTFKQSSFTATTEMAVESFSQTGGGDNLAVDLGFEVASTRRFSDRWHLASSYHAKTFFATDSNGRSSDFLNQDLLARAFYRPSRTTFLEFVEQVQTNSGSVRSGFANSTVTANNVSSNLPLGSRNQTTNEYLRFVTSAGAGWAPLSGFTTGLRSIVDVLTSPGAADNVVGLVTHNLDYSSGNLRFYIVSTGSIRDDGSERPSYAWDSSATLGYRPNRSMDLGFSYKYGKNMAATENSTFAEFKQKLGYILFKQTGANRKWADLSEEFVYTQSENTFVSIDRKTLRMNGRFYPTSRITLTGGAGYSLVNNSALEQYYSAGIGMNFKLLDATIDYTYAKRDTDNRIEKRLAALVKRSF